MSAFLNPSSSERQLQSLRSEAHPFCLVCSQANPLGLGLEFDLNEDGSVSSTFHGHSALEGFSGLLHGGVIASLLDGAMTNCLFAHGHAAVTAELNVRYHHPVVIGNPITVRAWIQKSHARLRLHLLEAELSQDDQVKAQARAKFMDRS